ncbi:MAG TPA: phosphoribosyltransferase family protein [Magnetospirillaceae bacterium]|nr:phosphoribosyltransferase family protein [Magnetospirillaceae bacterium]
MSVVYYKSRREAGEKAIQAFAQLHGQPVTVVSLNTDSLVIGAMLSSALGCPLQLYVTTDIDIPGNLNIGSVNQSGGYSDSSELSSGESDYYYQEFRGYIEDTKRSAFSSLNRELKGQTVIRKDLLKDRHIIIVDDCMTDQVTLDSFIEYLKSISYHNLYVCTPIISSKLISHVRQLSEFSYFEGTVEFFYGKDHYFEDNSVYDRNTGIKLVSDFLKLWPTPA